MKTQGSVYASVRCGNPKTIIRQAKVKQTQEIHTENKHTKTNARNKNNKMTRTKQKYIKRYKQ